VEVAAHGGLWWWCGSQACGWQRRAIVGVHMKRGDDAMRGRCQRVLGLVGSGSARGAAGSCGLDNFLSPPSSLHSGGSELRQQRGQQMIACRPRLRPPPSSPPPLLHRHVATVLPSVVAGAGARVMTSGQRIQDGGGGDSLSGLDCSPSPSLVSSHWVKGKPGNSCWCQQHRHTWVSIPC
jgi:hypothetical protein